MAIESELTHTVVRELADADARRSEEWVSSWLGALFDAYQKIPHKGLSDGYKESIEPLVFWLTPEQRVWLGEALWQTRREWLERHSGEEPYPLMGLASYLAPHNNSGS